MMQESPRNQYVGRATVVVTVVAVTVVAVVYVTVVVWVVVDVVVTSVLYLVEWWCLKGW